MPSAPPCRISNADVACGRDLIRHGAFRAAPPSPWEKARGPVLRFSASPLGKPAAPISREVLTDEVLSHSARGAPIGTRAQPAGASATSLSHLEHTGAGLPGPVRFLPVGAEDRAREDRRAVRPTVFRKASAAVSDNAVRAVGAQRRPLVTTDGPHRDIPPDRRRACGSPRPPPGPHSGSATARRRSR